MTNFDIWFPGIGYRFPMIFVKGTGDTGFLFNNEVNVTIRDFFISKYTITQKLWEYIMGSDPAKAKGPHRPAEEVSFDDIINAGGFIDKLNAANGSKYKLEDRYIFRLPSETKWEYAARGGIHWKDGFIYSGSNDINEVAWHGQNSGPFRDPDIESKGRNQHGTATHDVGLKSPNQIGISDMCGNVWEWCEDFYQPDIHKIPADGTPYNHPTDSRVLRGGCHHNWPVHCTVSKRYQIEPQFKDGCIGFRIAAAIQH
jgi:formylglycine-generating enzyme